MARTRGGAVQRQRPIASVRRKRAVNHANEVEEPHEQEQVPPHAEEVPVHHVESFPGGPEDMSILRSFQDHVATKLWIGDDRGELKVVANGRKVRRMVIHHEYIQTVVDNSGLAPLLDCSYRMVDKGLLSAFAERWHKETNSFHLPCGEMTITLDDVSCLLHIPITGAFISHPIMSRDIACDYLVELLGVTRKEAVKETNSNRGAHVRFRWLLDVYQVQLQKEEHLHYAARAFLLCLVGGTIFANKSATYVSVVYLDLFRDLTQCSRYAWGAAALAVLYEHLVDASMHHTRQMGGYMTLLQAWIFEHFPSFGSRRLTKKYNEDTPRASRWTPVRGAGEVLPFRTALDRLMIEDVCWMPYAVHREYRPFQDISLYSGYIRCGPLMHAHLPERVLRQYGYVQGTPRSPYEVTGVVTSPDEMDDRWLHYTDHMVDDATRGPAVTHPGQCVDGYLQWFHRISHPYVIPPGEGDPHRMSGSRSIDTHPSVAKFQKISKLLRSMLDRGLVTEGTEAFQITHDALNISSSGTAEGVTYKRRKKTRSTQ